MVRLSSLRTSNGFISPAIAAFVCSRNHFRRSSAAAGRGSPWPSGGCPRSAPLRAFGPPLRSARAPASGPLRTTACSRSGPAPMTPSAPNAAIAGLMNPLQVLRSPNEPLPITTTKKHCEPRALFHFTPLLSLRVGGSYHGVAFREDLNETHC